jgi:hypothetical protein
VRASKQGRKKGVSISANCEARHIVSHPLIQYYLM